MKRYKLLKDLPTFKAGQLAYISKTGNLTKKTSKIGRFISELRRKNNGWQ